MSGGQRQRIMVARALMLNPKLIIADEPVSMIDASLRTSVLANLRQLRDEYGISLVYITHDLTTAYQICDDIIVLYRGYVAEAGDVGKVVKEPQHPVHPAAGQLDPLARSGPAVVGRSRSHRPWQLRHERDRGCPFAARCPSTFERCLQRRPAVVSHSRRGRRPPATCIRMRRHWPLSEMDELLVHMPADSSQATAAT